MLKKLNRDIEKYDCIGFSCMRKKVKYPIWNIPKLSDDRKEPPVFRSDHEVDLDSSWTPSSSVTPVSRSSGCINNDMQITKPNLQGTFEIYDTSSNTGSSSLTPLSVVGTSWSDYELTDKTSDDQGDADSCNLSNVTASSSLTPVRRLRTGLPDEEIKSPMTPHQIRRRNIKDFDRTWRQIEKERKISDTESLKFHENSIRLEVLGNGTRLMRSIKFPTVIIQMRNKKLNSSMVYYVILKSTLGRYIGDISGLLFANPFGSKDVQRAELLPLHTVRSRKRSGAFKLGPLLLLERYKCLFEEGCTFEVKALECGRRSNWKKGLWKNYDRENLEIHDLLCRLVCLDISLIPTHMLKLMTPLRIAENRMQKRRRRRRKSYKSSLKIKKSPVVPIKRVTKFDPNLFYRLNRGSGSNLAERYKSVPPHFHKDKDFFYNPKLIETKYTDSNVSKFHKYLNVSDFI